MRKGSSIDMLKVVLAALVVGDGHARQSFSDYLLFSDLFAFKEFLEFLAADMRSLLILSEEFRTGGLSNDERGVSTQGLFMILRDHLGVHHLNSGLFHLIFKELFVAQGLLAALGWSLLLLRTDLGRRYQPRHRGLFPHTGLRHT